MKFTILILISFLTLSCVGYKRTSGTIIKDVDGFQFIENKKSNISIKYYGDYWFHNFTKKTTLNWDKNFSKSISFNKKRKILLFAAHTTYDPYFSTIGLLYKNSLLTETVNDIVENLKSKLKATNLTKTIETIGTASYTKLSYQLSDDKLKVSSRYLEYYSISGENVFRVVFWTTDSNENLLEFETKGIIESIKSGT